MKLKFYKIRENAKLPARAHSIDAGMDLFYCPDPNQNPDCYWQLEGEYSPDWIKGYCPEQPYVGD